VSAIVELAEGQVTYERRGFKDRVAWITLNRPEYRNAQSRVLREGLDEAFAMAVDEHDVRVIVLAGEGEHWSSGHDLGTPQELADQQARPAPPGVYGKRHRSYEDNVANTMRWRDVPKPTIAAVHGFVIYGGWMIASAMDLIVAADNTRFLPGHVQYFSVPWELGPRKAKEMLWRAEFLDAEAALEAGFVSHVVALDELDAFTLDLANDISRQDPLTATMVKRSINQMQDRMGYRDSIESAHNAYMLLQLGGSVTPPGQEGKTKRLPGVQAAMENRDD
jgi:enoyl-CoA hydratase